MQPIKKWNVEKLIMSTVNTQELKYTFLLQDILSNGIEKSDRTGTGTIALFHRSLRFDLQKGFPLLTTKFVSFKSVLAELLWFISGSTNNNDLRKMGCTIWDEWADGNGELGEIYGFQWRKFSYGHDYWGDYQSFDQLSWLINEIKTNPDSRRLYVTAANPLSRNNQALDCCHNYFQVQILNGKLNLYFQMRSSDVFLGLPFNIASYALLAHMLALETRYEVGELVYSGVDVHLYSNHIEQAKTQAERIPLDFPELKINKKPFFEYTMGDFEIVGYEHLGKLSAPVAV
ncbi:thymidylate synthase [Acinetobacter phage HFM1]|nr:thymidylate synthase [Acinetobacter phage HFM1]